MKALVKHVKHNALAVAAILIAVLAASGTSFALSGDGTGSAENTSVRAKADSRLYACLAGRHRTLNHATADTVCPRGQRKISWGKSGPRGQRGKPGTRGPVGPRGLAGRIGATGPAGVDGAPGPTGPAGAAGNDGVAGPTGATGATGQTGPQGPEGATFLTGRINDVPGVCNFCNVTSFGGISGTGDAIETGDWNVAFANVVQMSPPVAVRATELSVFQTTAPPGGNRQFNLMVNGEATALACVPPSGGNGCSGSSDPGILLPANSFIALRMTGTTGTAANPPTDVMVTLTLKE